MRVDSMPLAVLAEVRSGGGAPQESRAFTASGHPFVRASSLPKLLDGASEDSLEHLEPDAASEHGLRLFPSGTVLFAKSGMSATKGHVYRLRRPAYVVNHLAALIPRHADDSAFLVRLLERFSPVVLVKDPAYPSIRLGDIENMIVLAPPNPGDRLRIAEVLDRVAALRAKRRAALAQLDTLTQSIFLDMFGDQVETDTPNGRVRLESITSLITKGTTPTSVGYSFADHGVPFVRVQNLVSGVVNWEGDILFIGAETHKALSRSQIRAGDLLVSIAGTIGRVAIVPLQAPELNCNQAVAIIRPTAGAVPEYLAHWLQGKSAQRQMLGAQVTGTISNLSLTQLRDLKITVPAMPLQREFARRLAAAERMKAGHRASLAQLNALFASLQFRAFTGGL